MTSRRDLSAAGLGQRSARARGVGAAARRSGSRRSCRLTLAWYDVLLELNSAPDRRLRMSDLGERVVLSRTRVSRVVDELERAGLVAARGQRRGPAIGVRRDDGRGSTRVPAGCSALPRRDRGGVRAPALSPITDLRNALDESARIGVLTTEAFPAIRLSDRSVSRRPA